jgi:hypothetical protein
VATSGRTGDVLCPFYKGHQGLFIVCESPIPDAICIRTTFKDKTDFGFHLMQYCCHRDYKKCEVYLAIRIKYED